MQQVAALRPKGSIIVEEAPSSQACDARSSADHRPRRVLYLRQRRSGAWIAGRDRHRARTPYEKIIALLGDGSSMHAIQGLWSAAQLALGVTFVIIKNQRYEALLKFGHHFRLQRTIGTSLPNVDFCALARGQALKQSPSSGVTRWTRRCAAPSPPPWSRHWWRWPSTELPPRRLRMSLIIYRAIDLKGR
jgi:benzoylformate decarboxylase